MARIQMIYGNGSCKQQTTTRIMVKKIIYVFSDYTYGNLDNIIKVVAKKKSA